MKIEEDNEAGSMPELNMVQAVMRLPKVDDPVAALKEWYLRARDSVPPMWQFRSLVRTAYEVAVPAERRIRLTDLRALQMSGQKAAVGMNVGQAGVYLAGEEAGRVIGDHVVSGPNEFAVWPEWLVDTLQDVIGVVCKGALEGSRLVACPRLACTTTPGTLEIEVVAYSLV